MGGTPGMGPALLVAAPVTQTRPCPLGKLWSNRKIRELGSRCKGGSSGLMCVLFLGPLLPLHSPLPLLTRPPCALTLLPMALLPPPHTHTRPMPCPTHTHALAPPPRPAPSCRCALLQARSTSPTGAWPRSRRPHERQYRSTSTRLTRARWRAGACGAPPAGRGKAEGKD